MASNTQSNHDSVLTDDRLNGVSGGTTFHYPIRSNGDNPFVQAVLQAARRVLAEGLSQPDHA